MTRDSEKPYTGWIAGCVHSFAVRVYIEDTDMGGVVYHANYLCYLERARSDLLRALGIDQRRAFETGKGIYAVTEVRVKYLRPAKLDDSLLVHSRVEGLRAASCTISQTIARDAQTITEAAVAVAFLGPQGRPKRQPSEWVEKFRGLMPSDSSGSALSF